MNRPSHFIADCLLDLVDLCDFEGDSDRLVRFSFDGVEWTGLCDEEASVLAGAETSGLMAVDGTPWLLRAVIL
jgi:hypothetical protein